ncbi:hypothetical protein OG871_34965 [Kitasatospora sp. NBC_00374]|uniref:hypothetical protein n=1 Tax=Kitasatospora sp. NBC_00374 TaxID=2975964 RepID=UPI0030E3B092
MWTGHSRTGTCPARFALLDRETTATDGEVSRIRFTGPVKAAVVITALALDVTEQAFALYTARAPF